MKRTYIIVIEGEPGAYSALAPDGIAVGVGDTVDEARASVRDGLLDALEAYTADGRPAPGPSTTIEQARAEHPGAIVEALEVDVAEASAVAGRP